ncbi:MAG: transposase, partial [Thermales bacterium]|nr:transposase [Thermales bacterium]
MFSSKLTIKDLRVHFSTDDQCLDYLFSTKYNKQEVCPKCNRTFNYSRVKERRAYQCNHCNSMISPTAGTIFHKSETQLNLWFYTIFLFCVSKNGVSAKELERQLGVTYKTAWRMAKQIRSLFEDDANPLQ